LRNHNIEVLHAARPPQQLLDPDWLRARYERDSMEIIAQELACSRSTVHRWLHTHDIAIVTGRPSDDERRVAPIRARPRESSATAARRRAGQQRRRAREREARKAREAQRIARQARRQSTAPRPWQGYRSDVWSTLVIGRSPVNGGLLRAARKSD